MQHSKPIPHCLPINREQKDTLLDAEQRVLRLISGLTVPPADQRNDLGGVDLYRAVSLVREASRRGLSFQEAARCACRLLGIEDTVEVERLAVEAERACERARLALRAHGDDREP